MNRNTRSYWTSNNKKKVEENYWIQLHNSAKYTAQEVAGASQDYSGMVKDSAPNLNPTILSSFIWTGTDWPVQG